MVNFFHLIISFDNHQIYFHIFKYPLNLQSLLHNGIKIYLLKTFNKANYEIIILFAFIITNLYVFFNIGQLIMIIITSIEQNSLLNLPYTFFIINRSKPSPKTLYKKSNHLIFYFLLIFRYIFIQFH